MKKIISLLIIIMAISISKEVFSKPIYISIRLGIYAKWQVAMGNCDDGMGICLTIGNSGSYDNNAQLGFDQEFTKIIILKTPITSVLSKEIENGFYELKADSPIDPSIIKKLPAFPNPNKKTVVLLKGNYPVITEGEYYVISFSYSLQ